MSLAPAFVGLEPDGPDIRHILQTGAVTLAFQPIVDLETGAVPAVEALSRFDSGDSPMSVFRTAEQLSLGAELEAMVLRKALGERYRVPDGVLLTVNVSPARLLTEPVRSVVTSADLSGVVLELTEHTLPPPPDLLLPMISLLRERGALIALDDAGAGYQNLTQVAELRPDWVKIDRKVVTGAAQDPVRRASLEMFARVSRRVQALAVAEGVESDADLGVLQEVGIPLGQGYLLGEPMAFVRAPARSRVAL
jgi:EAL domain-containing protein (putative c-di-GMP-specific phosphodiesterase class I)